MVVATYLFEREDKMNIIQISSDAPQSWRGQTLEIPLQAASTDLENLLEKIHISKDTALIGKKTPVFQVRKKGTPEVQVNARKEERRRGKEHPKKKKTKRRHPWPRWPLPRGWMLIAKKKRRGHSDTVYRKYGVSDGITQKIKETNGNTNQNITGESKK